jgi:hypothetical protein
MEQLTINEAVGVLISAADARMMMWRGVAEGKSPDHLVDDLWDSASGGNLLEAEDMAGRIEAAIDKVRVFRDAVL